MEIKELINVIDEAEDYKALVIPFVLMLIDVFTGVFHAWSTGHLKSYKMREGLSKKVAEMAILVIGQLFSWAFSLPSYLLAGVLLYIDLMELVSISENLDKMGVRLPKGIKYALRNASYKIQNDTSLKGDEEETNDDE